MKSKKYWLIGIGLVILLCIPVIIELTNPKYITAGDALAFWGAIIGTSVAIGGVYLTFDYNQKIVAEERRKSSLPLIAINSLSINEIEQGKDKDYDGIVILFEQDGIKQEPFLKSNYTDEEQDKIIADNRLVFDVFTITNVGVGSAINLGIFVDRNGMIDKEPCTIFNLLPKEKVKLIVKGLKSNMSGLYIMKFVYWDIYNNLYLQIHDFKTTDNRWVKLNTEIKQKLIEKSKQG